MKRSTTRTRLINLRVRAGEKKLAEVLAGKREVSVSALVRALIREEAEREGVRAA
jgi:hypothetical protein